jgi:hypothetical protein
MNYVGPENNLKEYRTLVAIRIGLLYHYTIVSQNKERLVAFLPQLDKFSKE